MPFSGGAFLAASWASFVTLDMIAARSRRSVSTCSEMMDSIILGKSDSKSQKSFKADSWVARQFFANASQTRRLASVAIAATS